MISHERALAPFGAMLQIMLVRSDAEALASWAPDDEQLRVQGIYRAIDRDLYSVLLLLSREFGIDPDAAGASYYMAKGHDPHDLVAPKPDTAEMSKAA